MPCGFLEPLVFYVDGLHVETSWEMLKIALKAAISRYTENRECAIDDTRLVVRILKHVFQKVLQVRTTALLLRDVKMLSLIHADLDAPHCSLRKTRV